jgi:hypothetical protein
LKEKEPMKNSLNVSKPSANPIDITSLVRSKRKDSPNASENLDSNEVKKDFDYSTVKIDEKKLKTDSMH